METYHPKAIFTLLDLHPYCQHFCRVIVVKYIQVAFMVGTVRLVFALL